MKEMVSALQAITKVIIFFSSWCAVKMVALVLLVVLVLVPVSGEIIRGRMFHPDEIDGSPCPEDKPIAASRIRAGRELKCLGVSEILKYGKLKDINERRWVHWNYKHYETYVFENFSWKKEPLIIQHDKGYIIIEPRPGRLQMIKRHEHGYVFRTRGKDFWNPRLTTPHQISSTSASPTSPRWVLTTGARTSAAPSTSTSYVSTTITTVSHHSTVMTIATKTSTRDHLPPTFTSTTEEKKKKKKKTDPPPPTLTLTTTTSTPKVETVVTSVLVTSLVLGGIFVTIMAIKKYKKQRRVIANAEGNIFLNPLFTEETAV